ncbi:MAG: hypothetical protein H6832_15045 [Planctomycetes bacterium]|nr:hypothetical protein [Planctomycetota bacterium]
MARALALACLLCSPLVAQAFAVPGLSVSSWTLPRPAKNWTVPVLFDGALVAYDGQVLRRFHPGTKVEGSALATVSAPVFSSFLALGPSGRRLFFGESSTGGLFVYDADTKTVRRFSALAFNYQVAFHPLEGERFLYVSGAPSTTSTQVVRIDTVLGTRVRIADVPGSSGPIAFDRFGNLFYSVPDYSGPKKGSILRWSSGQVLAAIHGVPLTPKDATQWANGFDTVGALAFDPEGTLHGVDALSSRFVEFGGGALAAPLLTPQSGETLTQCTPLEAAAGAFERFGSAGAGFRILGTDFATATDRVHELTPRRPQLRASDMQPPPSASLSFTATDLPASVPCIVLFGTGLVPERPLAPLGARGLWFPLFGIVPTLEIVSTVMMSDSSGTLTLQGNAPSRSGSRWTTQVLAGPVPQLVGGDATSPWITSLPVSVSVR